MVINCINIEAEIYGIIPKAKMDALENEPPANVSKSPNRPFFALSRSNLLGSIPGRETCEPKR